MVSPQALAIALAIALSYFAITEVAIGVKWVGHEAKRGGTAVVHLLKKIVHPHSAKPEDPNVRELR